MIQIYLPNIGSFMQPFILTPFVVGSIRKCLTSSWVGSEPGFICTLAGGLSTLSASPYAPGKLLLSRIRNVPGALSLSRAIAIYSLIFFKFCKKIRNFTNIRITALTFVSRYFWLVPKDLRWFNWFRIVA